MNKGGFVGKIIVGIVVLVVIIAIIFLWGPVSNLWNNFGEVDSATKCTETTLKIDSVNINRENESADLKGINVLIGRSTGKYELSGIAFYLEMIDGTTKKVSGIVCNDGYPSVGEVVLCPISLAQAGGDFSKVKKVKISAEFGKASDITTCPTQVEYPVLIA